MSDPQQTEVLLQRMVDDGAACHPVPRLRVVAGGVAALSALVAALYLYFGVGLRPDLALLLGGDLHFAGIWIGLLTLAAGAGLWVVAGSVPGRAAAERVGRRIAIAGALLGFVVSPLAVLIHSGSAALHAEIHDFACMGGAFRVAALPGAALLGWVLWTAPARPVRTALCAALGAGALGALVVHASCPADEAGHWVRAHALTPLAAMALAGLPVWGFGRWQAARRRRPL